MPNSEYVSVHLCFSPPPQCAEAMLPIKLQQIGCQPHNRLCSTLLWNELNQFIWFKIIMLLTISNTMLALHLQRVKQSIPPPPPASCKTCSSSCLLACVWACVLGECVATLCTYPHVQRCQHDICTTATTFCTTRWDLLQKAGSNLQIQLKWGEKYQSLMVMLSRWTPQIHRFFFHNKYCCF